MSLQPVTAEELKEALPEKLRRSVTKEVLDSINSVISDPELYEDYRNNLLSYGKVLADGKFQIPQYLAAVKYVCYKLRGLSNIEAYRQTFPDRIQRFVQQGVSEKDIASYVSAYHRSKLVGALMQQVLTPMWVLNQDLYQKALNTQAELMMTAKSEMVRTNAANSLLLHLRPPEAKKVELEVGVREDNSIAKLREATLALAAQQRQMLQAGMITAQEAAHSQVIPKEVIDVEAKEI